ncbi:hypothetical protein [Bizionia myxarmorum]|uniref:Lipocalin-like domain-containing protein n=1 Tax=Bizionia myxarmorum TaxID=291186 RepID=A0A5D0RB06_9FLAO|nr:hypothetical protein [Bizionia myxarmorum]TYB78840.1 hypothetical protein ES674_03430 [Bizionia myxarmorum]
MKQLIFFALIIFQTIAFSQVEAVSGTYNYTFNGSNGSTGETIILLADGSFEIQTFKKLDGGHPPEDYTYGKGSWELKKKIIHFSTTDTDFDSKFTLNLNTTQAQFDTKSPRDISNTEVPTTLRIFKSDVAWLVGRTLEKE